MRRALLHAVFGAPRALGSASTMQLRSLVPALLILFATTANAASWFVAPNGNDGAAGTAEAPFATITRGAAAAKAGDVVNVRGGVYKGVVTITAIGTQQKPVIVRAIPNETPIVDGAGTPPATNLIQLLRTQHVQLLGFEVRNATGIGIFAFGTKQTTIAYNKVHDCARGGIWAGDERSGISSDITIRANTVAGNVLQNAAHTAASGWPQAVAIYKTTRATVSGNWIYRNHGEGIAFILSDHCVASDNQVWDNYSVGIYLDNVQWATAERNFVRSSGDTHYFRNGQPPFGIAMANETYDVQNPLDHITIANNTVVRCRSAIYYGDYERGGGLRNTRITSNTCYQSTEALLRIDAAAHRNVVVERNVFAQAGTAPLAKAARGVTYRANRWNRPDRDGAAGRRDVIGEIAFANAGGSRAEDYAVRR